MTSKEMMDAIPLDTKVPIVLWTETYKLSAWIRAKMDLSRNDFDRKVDCNKHLLANYEGKMDPLSITVLKKLSKHCKCSFWISGKLIVLINPPKTKKFIKKYSECYVVTCKNAHFLYAHLAEIAACSSISFWIVAGEVCSLSEQDTRELREMYIENHEE